MIHLRLRFLPLAAFLLVLIPGIAQPQQAAAPDLVVMRAIFSPPNPTTADHIMISVEMRNQGNGAATIPSGSFQWMAYKSVGGSVGGVSNGAPLPPGLTFMGMAGNTLVEPGTLPPGTYQIRVKVDPDNRCVESNENNNELMVSLTIAPPRPDLVVTRATFSPPHPTTADRVIINVEMRNLGNSAATIPNGSFQWMAYKPVGGSAGGVSNGAPIPSGVTFMGGNTLVEPGTLQPGTYQIRVKVDPDNRCVESNENNNELVVSLTIAPPGPDLVVTRAILSPPNPTTADRVMINVEMRNQGNVAATIPNASYQWMAYKPVGGSAGGVSNGVPIGPGITFMGMGGNPLVEPGTLQPGTYQIRVKVDPDNRCVESNENNNELMVSLTIAPPPQAMAPDLVVTRATFTPPNPTTADRVTINVEMRNQGNGAATIPSGSFQWMAYKPVGGNIGGFSPGAPIPSGITFMGGNTLVEPGTLPPGTYQIRVKVDPDNRCAESNENNNELVVSLTIAQPQQAMTPDLVVTRATFTPPNPTTADRVMINVEMRNQGNGAATIPSGAPQWTADRPVGGGVGGSSNGAPIAPGIIFTAGIALVEPGSLQPGTYPIRVKVDPDNRCAESNENNNEVVVSLTITPLLPDLVISEMARMGESANVKVTVMNQGLGTANFPANSLIVGGGDLSTQYAGNQGEIFGPGVSKTYMLTKMNLQAGTFTWKTTVDPDRKLMETDENNNEKTITVTVKKDKD